MRRHLRPALLAFGIALTAGTAHGQVPTPESVFGFPPGADFRLADYPTVARYFRALAEASPRVVLEDIGPSTLGQPMLLAIISSEENLARREHYRDVSRRLATAADLTADEAAALARDGRVIVWVDGGLHATEVAHGQVTPELAHWLATDEGDEARRIRDQAIVLIMSNMNPDGLNIVADWYLGNVGTPYETAPVPELYHPYIGHDNNRDWYMFTQAETRNVARQLYHAWFPQIVYNHHQSGPFPGRIWVPPFENPVNPNLDPLIVTSLNEIGEAMKKRFAFEGKPGVSSGIVYDLWWNGSMRGAPDFHNMLGFLSETALYRYATPYCYGEDEIPESFGARSGFLPANRPTTQYPDPWEGGCWHIRDAMDYMVTATRAVLDHASRHREDYLRNIHHMGARQIARGNAAEGGPFAYVLDPAAQHDAGALDELLGTFALAGIDIRRAEAPFRAGGRSFPAGAYVIGPQAFRPFVVDLMEPKVFPDRRLYPGGPPDPPYDMTGYELSLQMGITVDRVSEAFPLPPVADLPPFDDLPAPLALSGNGSVDDSRGSEAWALAPVQNNAAVAVNGLLARGARVRRLAEGSADDGLNPGTFLVDRVDRATLDSLAREAGVRFVGLPEVPARGVLAMGAPRIGIYRGHVANMPEGWTRWVLDKYGFTHEPVDDERIRSGDLEGLDVLVFPDQSSSQILHGHAAGSMPPEYLGGLGEEGVAALRTWVENGGWVMAMDNAADFAIEALDLPLRNLVADLPPEEFFVPGTLLNMDVEAEDPMAWGMSQDAVAFFVRSQSLELDGSPRAGVGQPVVYARYAETGLLASGWVNGADEYVAGRVAGVRVPVGQGQVVITAFQPHFRGQPHNTFKLLFSPLYGAATEGVVGRSPTALPDRP